MRIDIVTTEISTAYTFIKLISRKSFLSPIIILFFFGTIFCHSLCSSFFSFPASTIYCHDCMQSCVIYNVPRGLDFREYGINSAVLYSLLGDPSIYLPLLVRISSFLFLAPVVTDAGRLDRGQNAAGKINRCLTRIPL